MKVFSNEVFSANYYRIPSIVTTKRGTVIACVDARYSSGYDNPNRIDKLVRRSFDNGETWGDPILAVEYVGEGCSEGAAAIDPSLVYDEQTDTIWMFYCHTPGGVGLVYSMPGKGVDTEGNRYLYDIYNKQYILKNGKVYDMDDVYIGVDVIEGGNCVQDEKVIGNIFLGTGPYLEARTSFLEAVYSTDDGETWSAPMNLNLQVKEEWMRFIGPGPGVGIQMQNPKYKGRLIVPIYFSNHTNRLQFTMSCALIMSDDNGKTWTRGSSPNDGRVDDGEVLQARTLTDFSKCLTESQVVELNDGRLMYLMRNHDPKKRTARTYSEDGGMTWAQIQWIEEFVDPTCQSSLIKYPDLGDGKERILFANPANASERINGTVRLSEDGGQSFPYSKVITEGAFLYSSMVVLKDGEIGMLYEGDEEVREIEFVKFSLDWIKSKW